MRGPSMNTDLYNLTQNIRIKIEDGTKSDGPILCKSCRNGMVRSNDGGKQQVICTYNGYNESSVVPFKVVQCNRYFNRSEISLGDMEEVAWRVVPKKGGSPGFVNPQEFVRIQEREKRRDD